MRRTTDIETAVFIFAGFLESGKTTALQGALRKMVKEETEKILILCTEEGEEEYRIEELQELGITVVQAEDEELISLENLREIAKEHQPEKVYIEFNGMWDLKAFLERPLPENWYIANVFSLVDASMYELYQKNMRKTLMNPLSVSDVILFNRCENSFRKGDARRAMKILNNRADVFFTRPDGSIDNGLDEFSLAGRDGILEIDDSVFCSWFVDCIENTGKYYDRTVHFIAMVVEGKGLSGRRFYVGRYAAICCPEDAQFIGFVAEYEGEVPEQGEWIEIEATVEKGATEGTWAIVLLKIHRMRKTEAPKEKFLYF